MIDRSTTQPPRRPTTVKDGDLATPMDLREFLEGVGTTMRLPPKTTVAMMAVREEPTARPRRVTPVVLPLLAVVSLGLWAVSTFRPPPVATLPAALHGVWVTDEPRYVDRSVEFSDSAVTVVFPTGREATVVRDVRVTPRGDTLAMVVHHGDVGRVQELSLALVGGATEHLVLRNPEAVRWVRRAEGSGMPNAQAAASPPLGAGSVPR